MMPSGTQPGLLAQFGSLRKQWARLAKQFSFQTPSGDTRGHCSFPWGCGLLIVGDVSIGLKWGFQQPWGLQVAKE